MNDDLLKAKRLNGLSDALFGGAEEMSYPESHELLRSAGVDVNALRTTLYQKAYQQAQEHWKMNRPLPVRLQQFLKEFRPWATVQNERELTRQAKAVVQRILSDVAQLPRLLGGTSSLTFSAVYRTKTELSDNDKQILERVREQLRTRALPEKP